MFRAQRITKEIRTIDKLLVCQPDVNGKLQILREKVAPQLYDFDGMSIFIPVRVPEYVLSLTHNWSANGRSVDWGIEPIMQRLNSIDGYRFDAAKEMEDQIEKREQGKKREFQNKTEDFFSEHRSEFKKAWSDINTSTLKK